jgi:hypothetical protein
MGYWSYYANLWRLFFIDTTVQPMIFSERYTAFKADIGQGRALPLLPGFSEMP